MPNLSRSLIEDILDDFKEEKITYVEYLIYFELKDSRVKTADSSAKAQKKWIKKYTEVLAKNKISPLELLKEADKNKDRIISVQELEKAMKQYVSSDEINFNDLQHILDAFDTNNDGKVTVEEYKTVVKKYAAKGSEEDGEIVKKVIKECRDQETSLKEAFSKCSFNTDGNLTLSTSMNIIRKASDLSKKEVSSLFDI